MLSQHLICTKIFHTLSTKLAQIYEIALKAEFHFQDVDYTPNRSHVKMLLLKVAMFHMTSFRFFFLYKNVT